MAGTFSVPARGELFSETFSDEFLSHNFTASWLFIITFTFRLLFKLLVAGAGHQVALANLTFIFSAVSEGQN